ncbi:histidine decarboxylase [Geopsychrobacter electrodiphilus]|uniref:histidine decarboxylase n=1 Tax=Geopsychrobacter electrodiphilus TaxID=225196 RepID=UPI0003671E73|nr:histidine decarboxylase [Geopsychrobacter electrodiphilus]
MPVATIFKFNQESRRLNTQDQARLTQLFERLSERTDQFLGYPVAKDFDYQHLVQFLDLPLNNIGDPFAPSTYQVDTREFEREVLEFSARLLRAEENSWWGYVTNGGSEGNLYGLYLARELFPKAMVYFSETTHYSVSKNLHLLGMRHIMIRAQESGEIDYADLRETLRLHRDQVPILFANIGTTMTEGKDDLVKIRQIFKEMAIGESYIHCDAALCGFMAPFLTPRPAFDFADGADSISISGHKFIGSPIPCGVVLARKRHVERIARSIAYIGNLDTTISGSRNGLTPLILWTAIRRLGDEGFRERVQQSLDLADYACARLCAVGVKAWRNPNALTVVFPSPSVEVRSRWQLASADGASHILTLPNVRREQIDQFVEDVAAEF